MQNQSDMKKYRLKKDLPTVRAGEVFVRKTNETMQTDMLYHVDSEDVFLPPSIEVDDIHNFDEWSEEVKEFGEWKPTGGKMYRFLNVYGEVETLVYLEDSRPDQFRLSIGNCYPTNISYDPIIKEQKLIPQALHRLKMAVKKAWFEFDGSYGPDWQDYEQEKLSIIYDYSCCKFKTLEVMAVQDLGQIYFPTEESCQTYIDNNPEDMKLLFGVE